MGVYRSAIITNSGESLISQALTGGSFLFSSAKASSYAYPQGTNIKNLTDLQDVQQTVIPSSVEVFNDTVVQVSARFSNEDVASKYFIQTIGLFAKLDSGEETLIAVVQATTPDEMPAQSAVSPSAFIYNIQMTVQQASQISITVNPAGTATVEEVASKVAKSGGDISDTIVQTIVTTETEYPMPEAGDNAKTILGKIIKFFTDIKSTVIGACYIGQLVTNTATNNDYLPAAASAVYKNAQEISKLNADKSNVNRSVDVADGIKIPLRTFSLSLIIIGHPQYSDKAVMAVAATLGRSDWSNSKLFMISGTLLDVGCAYDFNTAEHINIKSDQQIMWIIVLS